MVSAYVLTAGLAERYRVLSATAERDQHYLDPAQAGLAGVEPALPLRRQRSPARHPQSWRPASPPMAPPRRKEITLVTDVDEDQGNEDEFHKIFAHADGRMWADSIGWLVLFFVGHVSVWAARHFADLHGAVSALRGQVVVAGVLPLCAGHGRGDLPAVRSGPAPAAAARHLPAVRRVMVRIGRGAGA